VTAAVALEVFDPPGRKVMLEPDEILDPRHHPEHAIQTAIDQGLIGIVSPAEAEQATYRLAPRWSGQEPEVIVTRSEDIPVHRSASA
jgi:hypothetical protein